MIYLDCAATSFQKPPQVIRAVEKSLRTLASPGRGAYAEAMAAAAVMYDAREAAADFFRFEEPERIAFAMNATHALNVAIRSSVKPGARVVISGFEHNAVLRPLCALGADIVTAGRRLFDPEDTLEGFRRALPGADAAVCTHVSNVFGYILPIEEIAALCAEYGVSLIVDASQSAGALDIDCSRLRADYIAMPCHKSLLGIQGSGLLLCRADPEPLIFGGTGGDSLSRRMPDYLPDALEAGTQFPAAAAALKEGLAYIRRRGREEIEKHERELCRHMTELLKGCGELEQFSSDASQSGVLSFRSRTKDCELVASALAEEGICVRAGLHCAPLAHESAGTAETGTVRMSFSPFNTHAEIEYAAEKLIKII